MGNSFFEYLQQLELMAFFSGYPLLYAVILFIAGNKQSKNNFKSRMVSALSSAYALVGTLYLSLQLKNLYLRYSSGNLKLMIVHPYLVIWGLLSILFWIPALNKKKELSLVHSLIFFFFLARDLVLRVTNSSSDKNIIKNDMTIYTISILLNIGALALIIILSFSASLLKKDTNQLK